MANNPLMLDESSVKHVEDKLKSLKRKNTDLNEDVSKHLLSVLKNKDADHILKTLKEQTKLIDADLLGDEKNELSNDVGDDAKPDFDIDDKGDRDVMLSLLSNKIDTLLYNDIKILFSELDALDKAYDKEISIQVEKTKKELQGVKKDVKKPEEKVDNNTTISNKTDVSGAPGLQSPGSIDDKTGLPKDQKEVIPPVPAGNDKTGLNDKKEVTPGIVSPGKIEDNTNNGNTKIDNTKTEQQVEKTPQQRAEEFALTVPGSTVKASEKLPGVRYVNWTSVDAQNNAINNSKPFRPKKEGIPAPVNKEVDKTVVGAVNGKKDIVGTQEINSPGSLDNTLGGSNDITKKELIPGVGTETPKVDVNIPQGDAKTEYQDFEKGVYVGGMKAKYDISGNKKDELVGAEADLLNNENISKESAIKLLNKVNSSKNGQEIRDVYALIKTKQVIFDKLQAGTLTKADLVNDKDIRATYNKKKGFLSSERAQLGRIATIFNAVGISGLDAFYSLQNTDVKEAANAKDFKEQNEGAITTNPLAFLADRNSDGSLKLDITDGKADKSDDVGRIAPRALYDAFMDQGDKSDKPEDQVYEKLIDGPQTASLVQQVESMLILAGVDAKTAFGGVYTLGKCGEVLAANPTWKSVYLSQVDRFTYGHNLRLDDIVRKDKFDAAMNDSERRFFDASSNPELNKFQAEDIKLLETLIKGMTKEERDYFNTLSFQERSTIFRGVVDTMDKVPNAILGLTGLSVDSNQAQLLRNNVRNATTFKLSGVWKKNDTDAVIKPVFSTFVDLKRIDEKWYDDNGVEQTKTIFDKIRTRKIGVDIPIVNFSSATALNMGKVKSSSKYDGNVSVTEWYNRAGVNISAFILNSDGQKITAGPSFQAMMELATGIQKNYIRGMEAVSENQADFLKNVMNGSVIELGTDAGVNKTSLIESMKKATTSKDWKKYVGGNTAEVDMIITQFAQLLDNTGVFKDVADKLSKGGNKDDIQKNFTEAVQKQLYLFARGDVNQAEFERIQTMDGKTKFKKFGISLRAGIDIALMKDTRITPAVGAGIEGGVSTFKALYGPDGEQATWLDSDLKNGYTYAEKVPLGADLKVYATDLQKKMNVPGLKIDAVNGKLEFSLNQAGLSSANTSINTLTKLLNIYVKEPAKEVQYKEGKLIVGNVKLLNYASRRYYNQEAHYLIIDGKGTSDTPKKLTDADNGVFIDNAINVVDTQIFSNEKIKDQLRKNIKPRDGAKDATKYIEETVNKLVPKHLKVDEKTGDYLYSVAGDGNYKVLDISNDGLSIQCCDENGNYSFNVITDGKGKVEYHQESRKENVPLTSDILDSRESKEAYKNANELFNQIDFGALISKYKHAKPAFKDICVLFAQEPSKDNLVKLLDGLENNLIDKDVARKDGSLIALDAVKTKIDAIKSNVSSANCGDGECRLIANVFLARMPQGLAHAYKSGQLNGSQFTDKEVITYVGGKKFTLEQIGKMTMKDYLDQLIGRNQVFPTLLAKQGYNQTEINAIMKERNTLLDSVKNETSWKVEKNSNVIAFNGNMQKEIMGFNVIPVGETLVAVAGGKEMISKFPDGPTKTKIERKLYDQLGSETIQWAGFRDALAKKFNVADPKSIDNKTMESFLQGEHVTIGGKEVWQEGGKGLVMMYYGACFNESFGFDIGKIVVKEDTPELAGGFKLEKEEALQTSVDQGTNYIENRLDEKTLNLKAGASIYGLGKDGNVTTTPTGTGGHTNPVSGP